eukprot:1192876-Prorocentrum_minimum.AAC.2
MEWLDRGLMDNPQLWHFFGVRKYSGGQLNSPVVERLDRGLMAVSSSPICRPRGALVLCSGRPQNVPTPPPTTFHFVSAEARARLHLHRTTPA